MNQTQIYKRSGEKWSTVYFLPLAIHTFWSLFQCVVLYYWWYYSIKKPCLFYVWVQSESTSCFYHCCSRLLTKSRLKAEYKSYHWGNLCSCSCLLHPALGFIFIIWSILHELCSKNTNSVSVKCQDFRILWALHSLHIPGFQLVCLMGWCPQNANWHYFSQENVF